MLSSVSQKLNDLKHPYGSVQEVPQKRSQSTWSIMICGLLLLATVGVAAGVVLVVQAHHVTHTRSPPIIPAKDIGSNNLAATTCESQEKLIPGSTTCAICLNEQATPKVAPPQCPAGTYYDEEYTCSCIPCLKNACCPGGDVMNACPIGSFQPAKGGETCKQAVVSSLTDGFSYDEKRPLFTDATNAIALTKTVQTDMTCPSDMTGRGVATISGINLNAASSKFSIKVESQMVASQSTRVAVSKVGGSRIAGFAVSLAETCVPQDSVVSLGSVQAQNVASTPKTRVVMTNMKCDSDPRVFAALNEIESSTQGGRLSISVKSSARTNNEGLVRARVEFGSSTNVLSAGAAVYSFCSSAESMLAPGMIQTGSSDGGAIAAGKDVTKTVTLKYPMKCDSPRIVLGLTQLDATGGLAVNLELVSQAKTSFTMKFVSMGATEVRSIEAAYLATCPMNPSQVQADIDKTCPPVLCSNNKLVLNKPAYQSTTDTQWIRGTEGSNGSAKFAVDGNKNGDFWKGSSCTHTTNEVRPYWVADMGAQKRVCSVKIQNRQDCCSERLQNFVIFVTNKPPSGPGAQYNPTADEICHSMAGTFTGARSFPCKKTGRYIGIQLRQAAAQYLTLCEVTVTGA